jgi:hypothetical protein
MKTIKLPSLKESGLPQQYYDEAIAGLIIKGLVEMGEEDGESFYYLNEMGIMIAESLGSSTKLWGQN